MSDKCKVCNQRPIELYDKCKVCFFTGANEKEETDEEVEEAIEYVEDTIDTLGMVDEEMAENLRDGGILTVDDVKEAGRKELAGIEGITNTDAARLVAAAGHVLSSRASGDDEEELTPHQTYDDFLPGSTLHGVFCEGKDYEGKDCDEPAMAWVRYTRPAASSEKVREMVVCRHHYCTEFLGKNRAVDLRETVVDYLHRHG